MVVRPQIDRIGNFLTPDGITRALRIGSFKPISTGTFSRARKSLINSDPKESFCHTGSLVVITAVCAPRSVLPPRVAPSKKPRASTFRPNLILLPNPGFSLSKPTRTTSSPATRAHNPPFLSPLDVTVIGLKAKFLIGASFEGENGRMSWS